SVPIGVCTLETAPLSAGAWQPQQNFFTTTNAGQVAVTIGPDQRFFRLLSVDISPNSAGFNNLLTSYGVLSTITGAGGFGQDGLNNWRNEFEGAPAISVNLSRPHFAMDDAAGNVFIVVKDCHSIFMMTQGGMMITSQI